MANPEPFLDISGSQTQRDTTFWRACHQGDVLQVKALLEHGANVNTRRKYYMGQWARFAQYDNVSDLDKPDLDPSSGSITPEEDDEHKYWTTKKGCRWSVGEVSAIFVAISERHFEVAEHLLGQEGICLTETCTPDERSAFYQAVIEPGSNDLVRSFLALPTADEFRDLANHQGWSPLHYCAAHGEMAKATLLLQGKVDVDAKDRDNGSPPLSTAIWSCPAQSDVDMTRLLLMYGADVNFQSANGDTPLHHAAAGEYARLVGLLLVWGADENVENKDNKKPLDLISEQRSDVRTLLNPANVKKVKKERRDPWKPLTHTLPPVCKDFSIKITFGRRSRHGSDHVRTYTEYVDGFIYNFARFGDGHREDWLESLYVAEEMKKNEREKNESDVSPEDIWKWIHIPSNNMTWIKDLLAGMFHSARRQGRREEYWNMVEFFGDKCVSSQGATRQLKPHVGSTYHKTSTEPRLVSLAIPYIDFESDQFLDNRCKKTHESGKHRKLTDLRSQYPRFDGEYGVQHPQTLDQSYYDGLQEADLSDRNKDQVVYKWFRRWDHGGGSPDAETRNQGLPDEESSEAKLLMINQLWIWKLGDGTIITAFPDRWHDGPEHTLYEAIRQDVPNHVWETSDTFIEYLLSACVTFPLISSNVRLGFDILEAFEGWVGLLSCQEVTLFRDFRVFLKGRAGGGEQVESLGSETVHLSITEEVRLTYELRDVVDELFILNRLCTTQKDLVKQYLQQPHKKKQGTTQSGEQLKGENALRDVERFIDHTERLEDKAKKVIENLDKLIQVKQAQSALHESRVASEEAERSHRLNNYIMLFTAVTVVFTPLSFMTSIFALSIDRFPRNDEGEPRYISSWITGRLFAGELTSLAVIISGFLILRSRRNKRRQKKLVEMEPPLKRPPAGPIQVRSSSNGPGGNKGEGGLDESKSRSRIPTMETIKRWEGKIKSSSWKRPKKAGDVEEQAVEPEGVVKKKMMRLCMRLCCQEASKLENG
ncbi:hypothetical protein QBC44DRAFT_117318 [Cladorrhinum sp. PSN332]|nr:hypothetical protein QBC44DRAFT_117318 [Cladorrhinum sp. PSN332]